VARLGTPRLCYGDSWLVFSPDARLLAVASANSGVCVCQVATGKELWRADTPRLRAYSFAWPLLAFSPDGKVLALGGSDETVRLWDAPTGRELHKLQRHARPFALAFDPAGRSLAVGGDDGTVEFWDPAQGRSLGRLGDLPGVTGLAFTPDGKKLIALSRATQGGQEQAVSIWDVSTGREGKPNARVLARGFSAVLAPDGKCFAALRDDGKGVVFRDPATGKELCRIEGEVSRLGALAFAGNGRLLTATSPDGIVRVWETTGGKRVHQFRVLSTCLDSVALSPDGKLLALTGREDTAVHLWDVARGRELHAFAGHRHGPLAVAFLPDGRTVATLTRDHSLSAPVRDWAEWSLRRWDAASGKELAVTRADPGSEVHLMAFSLDGCLAAIVLYDGTLRLWDVIAGKELRHWQVPTQEVTYNLPPFKGQRQAITEPAFSPDGKVLLAAHGSRLCRWEVATGKVLPAFRVPGNTQFSRCFAAPDGRTLLMTVWQAPTPGNAPTTRLVFLDAARGRILREVSAGNAPLPPCAYAPDGKTLAVAEGGEVQLWEVASGQERGRLQTPERFVTGMVFSPDSRLLVTSRGRPSWLQLWHPASGRAVGGVGRPAEWLDCLRFSPDGARLAAAGEANTALICDVATFVKEPRPAAARLTTGELENLWADLTGTDGARAYQAIDRLAASPSESVPFLKRRLKLPPAVDDQRLARLIADLDADEFARREKATRELETIGPRAEAALRRALEGQPSPEVRTRAGRLVEKLNSEGLPPSPELVGLRVLESLEHAGSPLARQALTEVAAGDPDSGLARGAKAALGRLARRPPVAP
jgi:WD40 repeat protein